MVTQLKDDLASLRIPDTPRRSRRRPWIALAIGVALLAGAALAWRARVASGGTEVQVLQPSIEQGSGAAGSVGPAILTASGYVVARRKAVVSAKIQGRLAELRVEEGSRVREGDVLARLESTDYQAQVARAAAATRQAAAQVASAEAQIRRADAELAEARRVLAVSERLAREQVLPTDTLEATRSRLTLVEASRAQAEADRGRAQAAEQQARAEQQYARALLDNTVIRAPFTGTVVRKMAEVGESVAPIPPGVNLSTSSGAIVALADLDTLEVEVDVAEANVAKLGPAQPADVQVEAFPDKRYRAVLRQVIPTADRTKATVLVKVTILDKDADLKPEMSARATFIQHAGASGAAPAARQVFVPQSAVAIRDGAPVAFEVVGGIARARPLTVGRAVQGRVPVTAGLTGTETLVDHPPATLGDGARVRVKP